MKNYSKKSFAKRFFALALAVMMCVTCANSETYSNVAGLLFNSDESQNVVANAAVAKAIHPGDGTYYDCGNFVLKGSTTVNGEMITLTDGWDVSAVTTLVTEDTAPTLANTTGLGSADTNANIVCYSQYLGGLQHDANTGHVSQVGNIYNSKDVTDYRAPAAPADGITYYYIAKGVSAFNNNGTIDDTSDDYDEINWIIYAWPTEAGNPISYSNQGQLATEWSNIESDEALTGSDSEVASTITSTASLKSLFAKSRPVWESGNLKYDDWYNGTLNDGTVAGMDNMVGDGNNMLWASSTKTASGYDRPWLSLTLSYDTIADSVDNVTGITVAQYPLANAFPKNTNQYYKLAYGTTGISDKGDKKNPIAISKTSDHTAALNIAVSEGVGQVQQSPITLMSLLWSNAVHYNAAAYYRDGLDENSDGAPDDGSYFTEATAVDATTGADMTGYNTSVKYSKNATEDSNSLYKTGTPIFTPYYYKYSDITLDSARTQIINNYTVDSEKTTYNKTGAPTGARLYAMYVAGQNADKSSVYARLFDWDTAINSLKSNDVNKNFDEIIVANKTTTVNVSPVFDITYDFQRAAGTVSAQIPVSDPSIDTIATDKTTGSHTGIVSTTAGIVDRVDYENLVLGHEYELVGQAYVVDASGNTTIISGAKGTASWTATTTAGFVGVNINFNNTNYAGKTIVIYETLTDKTTGLVVAEHKEANDADQTVYYPSLTTKANIPATGVQTSEPLNKVTVTDAIYLTNLVVGDNYKVEGKLVDASTGTVVKNNNKDVTSTISFTADAKTSTQNMTFADVDLSAYAGKNVVIYQYLYLVNGTKSTIVYTANSKTDADETITVSNPTVTTVLAETDTDLKNITPDSNVKLTDTISYTNLLIGSNVDYVSVTKLVNADTKNDLLDAKGNKVTGEVSITGNTSATWDTEINLSFDGSNLENVTVVAYNYLYRVIGGERYLVVAEEDATNKSQTVMFPTTPTLDTVATITTGVGANDKTALISTGVVITDKVDYFGLEIGTNYTLTSTVFDKTAGSFLSNVSVTTQITPTKMNDVVSVKIPVDTSAIPGHDLVVYQELTNGSVAVASHKDANDVDQTVTVAVPSITTVATGEATEDHTLPATTTANIIDKVTYTGLDTSSTYTLTTKVYDKETGKLVSSINTVTTTLKPASANGSVNVTIKVPASTLVGKSLVVYEYLTLNGNEVATHADIDDMDQTVTVVQPVLTTKASDEETGKKKIGCVASASIEDVVTYTNLEPNTAYTLTATVYNKKTGKQINDIKAVTKSFTTGSDGSGEVIMLIPANTTELAGQKLVVYEELKLGTIVIASHKDIDDDDQTVEVASPAIDTVATSETTGDHTLPWSTAAVINDTVSYENLTKGQSYTLVTEVYDKSTQKIVSDTKAVTTTFTSESTSGDIVVSVTVDSSKYLGKSLVIYETLRVGTVDVVSHKDINDADQTVTVVNPSISTVALDSATGGHMMSLSKTAAIKDVVYYSGLANGSAYTLTSTVYDKATGLQITSIPAVTTNFTATGFSGSATVSIPVDTTLFPGKTLVVYETLSLSGNKSGSGTAGVTSIKHEDINDSNQTVFVGAVSTVLMNIGKTSHKIGVSRNATAVDTITFSGLEPGRTYTITGKLMNYDAVTGQVGVPDTTPKTTTTNSSSNSSSNQNTANTSNSNTSNTTANSTSSNTTANNSSSSTTASGSTSTPASTTSSTSANADSDDELSVTTNTTDSTTGTGTSSTTSSTTSGSTTTPASTTTANNSSNGNTSTNSNTTTTTTASSYVYGTNMAETVSTATINFVPTSSSGSVDVVFTVDTTGLQNHKLVAYETITDTASGAVVMEHKDINDADQTVTVGNSGHSSYQTGVESHTGLFVLISILALALAAGVFGFFAFKKKRFN